LARANPQPCLSIWGWTGNGILARNPIRAKRAWKALGVGGSRLGFRINPPVLNRLAILGYFFLNCEGKLLAGSYIRN
jgi:hypothetical protein